MIGSPSAPLTALISIKTEGFFPTSQTADRDRCAAMGVARCAVKQRKFAGLIKRLAKNPENGLGNRLRCPLENGSL